MARKQQDVTADNVANLSRSYGDGHKQGYLEGAMWAMSKLLDGEDPSDMVDELERRFPKDAPREVGKSGILERIAPF